MALSNGATIQETVAFTIGIRNKIFAQLNNSKVAWEMFLMSLQNYCIAYNFKEKMEALIQSLGGKVPMDVCDQVWRRFLAASPTDSFRASGVMTTDLVRFIETKDSKEMGNRAILVSLVDWINEWMENTLKK